LGKGDGTFESQIKRNTATLPVSIISGDFNNDMKLDIAVTNLGSNDVSVFLNECK